MNDLLEIVRASVAARSPVDQRERASVAQVLEALDALPAPFDRRADPVHVTGSGIITGARGVLLLEHRRLHIWVQPGGHLEEGETPWDAARRESEEETGLRMGFCEDPPELIHVDVHASAGGHTHLDLRYALSVLGSDDPDPPVGESQQVAWYRWPEAVAIADPGLRGLLRHLAPGPAGGDAAVPG